MITDRIGFHSVLLPLSIIFHLLLICYLKNDLLNRKRGHLEYSLLSVLTTIL